MIAVSRYGGVFPKEAFAAEKEGIEKITLSGEEKQTLQILYVCGGESDLSCREIQPYPSVFFLFEACVL